MALKSQQEVYDQYVTELQSQAPDLTDTNEGSMIDVLAGVTSSAVDEVTRVVIDEVKKTFFDTAESTDLERLAVDHFGTPFARPAAVKATLDVTFSRPNAAAGNCTILAGTVVKTPTNAAGSSQRFEVVSTVIMTGTSVNASVRAIVAGPGGNVQAGTVTSIETTISDSTITVTNAASGTGGADQEDDSKYRETIRLLLQTLAGATLSAIESKALTVAGVELAKAIEFLQYVKEWNVASSVTVGNYFGIPRTKLYIADANGTASAALIQDVKAAIKTVRAAGVNIDVQAAVAVAVNWTASLTLNPSGPNFATLTTDTSLITDAMRKYLQDLVIGVGFTRSAGRSAIMAQFGPSGTNDITDFIHQSPSSDISASSSQKIVPGTLGII